MGTGSNATASELLLGWLRGSLRCPKGVRSRCQALQVKRRVEGQHRGPLAAAFDNRDGTGIEANLPRPIDAQPQERGQVHAIDDVMRDHEHGLAAMLRENLLQRPGRSLMDLREVLAVLVAVPRRILHE